MKKVLMRLSILFILGVSSDTYGKLDEPEPPVPVAPHICCALISTNVCTTVSTVKPGGGGKVTHYEFSGIQFTCPQ